MRLRTLMLLSLAAVVMMMATAGQAENLQWSGGINLTEQTNQSGISSRLETFHNGELVACWFSTSGILPVVFNGLQTVAYGDFTGINKIERVVISPDSGKTQWQAEMVEGRGWLVDVSNLAPGSYSLEWGVVSKDRHNRLTLIIIPINWSSRRSSQTTNYLMVQSAPAGFEAMPKEMVFAYLRGFVPSWAMPDPSVVASQAVVGGAMASMAGAPIPTPTPQAQTSLGKPEKVILLLVYHGELMEIPVTVETTTLKKDQKIYFKRGGRYVATAQITNVIWHKAIEATVTAGSIVGGENVWM